MGRLCLLLALVWLAPAVGAESPALPAPARPWDMIVIHHSATATGSAELFNLHHRARGMINGLAYHFVIDNGTAGTHDGHIETGQRWVRQMQGGHCRQAAINEHAIGICLVGDFTARPPSARQLDALVLLVHGLQEQFAIPDEKVVGHGEVLGEFSECPGANFPWAEFRQRLEQAATSEEAN